MKFNKPYRFEGQDYTEIDLSGLDKLTIQDAIDIQKELINHGETAAVLVCETTAAFTREAAAKATGMPVEFFQLASRGISRQLFVEVMKRLSVDPPTENHVMKLKAPYLFEGQEYTEIDLNQIGELNSLSESAAENRIAQAGFAISDTSYNTLYACCLASMATGLPEKFFTGLPIGEVLKLRAAVNDSDFLE